MEHILAGVLEVWSFKLIDGPEGQVTVGKVIFALFFALAGYFVSKRLSYRFSKTLSKQFKLPLAKSATLETISFYIFYLLTLLFVLKLLEVPLTIFTVLGGAVAIGVGFGSQNIIRNFLSGLTVLLEQPIRVGDFVELSGVYGVVEAIGFRSTRIRTGENTHVIVPNSSFLEDQVLNWTLSDDIIRGKVTVGVAYGSDLKLVAKVLSEIHLKSEDILNDPQPFFVFTNFGDSALEFEYFFFCKVSTRTLLRMKESQVRFLIDEAFRSANITIAFPQLDVHLQNQAV